MSGVRCRSALWVVAVVGVAVLPIGARAAADEPASASPDGIRIAVAPFEGDPPNEGSGDGPDPAAAGIAGLVAARLAARPLGRVVPPVDLEPVEAGVAEASTVRDWAKAADVDSVVVGKRSRNGDGLAIVAELRSGHSGAALARYEASAAGESGLPEAAETLASSILADLGYVPVEEAALPGVAAAAGEASDGGGSGKDEDRDGTFGIGVARRDEPIQIRSEELEMIEDGEGRRILFSRNVIASQADITLRTDALEAWYPDGQSQPERLVAEGRVRVRQGERRARCDHAVYQREEQRVICRGHAELVQRCDRVRGEEIHFDLELERVRVFGAPSVVIHPDGSDGPTSCPEKSP